MNKVWNQNFHRGLTRHQLEDVFDYKKYIKSDDEIVGIKNAPTNKEEEKYDDTRNPTIHLSSASIPEEQRDGK